MTVSIIDGATGRWAEYSEDRVYRYALGIPFNVPGKPCVFLLLNPSTATESQDDPTVRRCWGFAMRWGFAGAVILNLFAFRATLPADMRNAFDPIGPDNDAAIRRLVPTGGALICAWGVFGRYRDRDVSVLLSLDEIGAQTECLGLTKAGDPRHPLYLKSDAVRLRFVGRHLVEA